MSKDADRAILFFPADWLEDEVSNCSLGAQGLWLRMMFVMHFSGTYGELKSGGRAMEAATIARRCGCELPEYTNLLDELDRHGVPGRRRDGTIYSRRMVRDYHRRNESRENGRKGGNPKLLQNEVNPPDNPPLNSPDKSALGMGMGNGSSRGESKREDALPDSLNTPEFREAWGEWKAHKKEKRSKLTTLAVGKALKKLEGIGQARAIAAIQHSIACNYQGVYEDDNSAGATARAKPNSQERTRALLESRLK